MPLTLQTPYIGYLENARILGSHLPDSLQDRNDKSLIKQVIRLVLLIQLWGAVTSRVNFENEALRGLQAEVRNLQSSECEKKKAILMRASKSIQNDDFYQKCAANFIQEAFLHVSKNQKPLLRDSLVQDRLGMPISDLRIARSFCGDNDSNVVLVVYESSGYFLDLPHLSLIRSIPCGIRVRLSILKWLRLYVTEASLLPLMERLASFMTKGYFK